MNAAVTVKVKHCACEFTDGTITAACKMHTMWRDAAVKVEKDRGDRDVRSIEQSWVRALGGTVVNKRHLIDALVVSTQGLQNMYTLSTQILNKLCADIKDKRTAIAFGLDTPAIDIESYARELGDVMKW